MQTERIDRENQSRYLKLLSNDELFANEEGRYSCFGAFDEDSPEALGVLVAQILPAYIRIVKLYTLPKLCELFDEGSGGPCQKQRPGRELAGIQRCGDRPRALQQRGSECR